MMLVDANLLLYAYHPKSDQHEASRAWLETVLSGTELVRFAWLTLWAFLRISTNARAFERPLSIAESHAAISSWFVQPVAGILEPGDRHGDILRTLMNDGEIDIMISFNPSEASTAIATGQLPPSVRSYVLERGTIGNASFVAIPYNAAHAAAAMVLADFLLSPEAQAHGQDPRVMGNFTVLALEKLAAEDRARFERLPRGAATLTNSELGRPLPEPHPSWMTRIVAEWERRVSR